MLSRLPWTPPPTVIVKARPRRINKDRHRHLVSTVAAILRSGHPTFFAYEAACRHGLRSGFCAAGVWPSGFGAGFAGGLSDSVVLGGRVALDS